MDFTNITINASAQDILEAYDNPPNPERVIEGLRDTGYDFNTAIADIVDNSIAAEATQIDILVNMDPNNEITVYIADNGIGMNLPQLINAMKYGSDRRPDPNSLGKFGLGLKTASTSFCRKLSLISKGDDNQLRKVQWDLDYVAVNGWKLKSLPVSDDEVEIFEQTAGDGRGTVVVWENNDRLFMKEYQQKSAAQKALDKKMEKLRFHLSAVYQRFLDVGYANAPNVAITLNNKPVLPWDPFCIGEANSELLVSSPYRVTMPNGQTSSFTLKAYAIPRTDTYSSKEAEKSARVSTDYMGFYIYRENRLIHYGDWLNMFVKDPHDSLLRIDFSFDHTLDDALNVDIKKSKIQLNEQIYTHIRDQFLPAPKRTANQKYRKGVNKAVSQQAQNAHSASNQNIEEKAPAIENSKVTVTDASSGKVLIQNQNGSFTHTIVVQAAEKPDECRVVPVDTLEGNVLWEPAIIDGKHAVRINKSHPYYQKVYFPVLSESVLITGMDALLWAMAETELNLYNDTTRDLYEDIRYQVSRALKKLVADLPDPSISDED